jgi:hypothetical protein
MAVVSVRDPHDVVASLYRVRLSRNGKKEGDEDDVSNVIRRMSLSYQALKEVMKGPHVILRYEEFYNNHSLIFQMIEETFGVVTPPRSRIQISGRFSVRENRKRAAKMKSFNDVDKDQVHGDHIGKVEPGYWQQELPSWSHEQVVVECWDIAREWGYESQ